MYRSKFLYTFTILVLTLTFFSCENRKQKPDMLNQALLILNNDPQKAKELLSEISTPDNMTESDYMEYQLAYFEAKYRTYDDIKYDSVIHRVTNYYDKKGDSEKGAYAYFYTAAYYNENKQYDKAMECYLMANYKASMTNNILLEGKSQNNIGYIYFIQGLSDSAIIHYNKAIDIYINYPNTENQQMNTLNSLALAYYRKRDYRSAIDYYKNGLALANEYNNSRQVAEFSHNIGSVYCDMGDIMQSKQYLYKALPITANKADSIRLYLNLARGYILTEQRDSIKYYSELVANNIAEVTYKPTLKLIYASLADYNSKINNHEEAMRYVELRNQINEEILHEQNAEKLIDANAKFTLILQEEALVRQRIWMCGLLLVALLIIFFIILFYKHKKRQFELENTLLIKEKMQLKLENDLIQQQTVSLLTTLNTYEEIIKGREEIRENIKYNQGDRRKLNELFDRIRENADELFVEWSKFHLKGHPRGEKIMLSLTNEELRIMHLAFLENPPEIIANMLGIECNDEDMKCRIATIRNKLSDAGMTTIEIDTIFKKENYTTTEQI